MPNTVSQFFKSIHEIGFVNIFGISGFRGNCQKSSYVANLSATKKFRKLLTSFYKLPIFNDICKIIYKLI